MFTSFIADRLVFQKVEDFTVCEPQLFDHKRFLFSEKPIKKTVQQKQQRTVKKVYTVTAQIFDQEALETLRSWENEGATIYAFMTGTHYLLWERATNFSIGQEVKDSDGLQGYEVTFTTESALASPTVTIGKGYQVQANGELLYGFIASSISEDGAVVHAIPPAEIDEESVFTWTIGGIDYEIETVTLVY